MLQNPVLVTGFPIPTRSREALGLDVSLEVLATLTRCSRLNEFLGRYYLKGFSTAVMAVQSVGREILWHFYFSPDGSRLPYPVPESDTADGFPKDITKLTRARHIVGWCSEADFHAGAPGMNYDIKPTKLKRPSREFALENVSFSVGPEIFKAGCQFSIGRKDPHVRITRGSYTAKLRWMDQKHVTLWDVDEERAWLVNGTAALMHLLRASLYHSKRDKFRTEFLFDESKLEESSNPLTLESALDVLLNPSNQKLELYPRDEHTYTETKSMANGSRETVTKTVISHTTLKDRAEELYETLEKLIDHNARAEASYKGADAKLRLRDQLEGWDFADIAMDRDPFTLKKATLSIHLMSWVDFTRAIPAITLFGRGFGDIIRATANGCKAFETVPRHRNLLCVSVADLCEIIDRIGDHEASPVTLAPGILWSISDGPFHSACPCKAKQKGKRYHHPIQQISSTLQRCILSKATTDLTAHQDGAVIFGSQEGLFTSAFCTDSGASQDASQGSNTPGQSETSTPLGHSSTSGVSSGGGSASVGTLPSDETFASSRDLGSDDASALASYGEQDGSDDNSTGFAAMVVSQPDNEAVPPPGMSEKSKGKRKASPLREGPGGRKRSRLGPLRSVFDRKRGRRS